MNFWALSWGGVGGVGENGGGDMEANCVHDDHGQDAPKDFLVAHDEMKPRVENQGLAGDHAIPTDGDDGHGQINVSVEDHELEEEAEGVQHTAITGNQQRPKVQSSMSFEGEKDLHVQFDDVPPGDCGKGDIEHLLYRAIIGFLPGHSFWIAHSVGWGGGGRFLSGDPLGRGRKLKVIDGDAEGFEPNAWAGSSRDVLGLLGLLRWDNDQVCPRQWPSIWRGNMD